MSNSNDQMVVDNRPAKFTYTDKGSIYDFGNSEKLSPPLPLENELTTPELRLQLRAKKKGIKATESAEKKALLLSCLDVLTYPELQLRAKKAGIKAKQSAENIKEQIKEQLRKRGGSRRNKKSKRVTRKNKM